MNWSNLTSEDTLEQIKESSKNTPVLLFKHSTRCSISSMVKARLERSWNDTEMDGVVTVILDLIHYQNLSTVVARDFDVWHESPQVLIIKNGISIYDASHMGISYENIKKICKEKVN